MRSTIPFARIFSSSMQNIVNFREELPALMTRMFSGAIKSTSDIYRLSFSFSAQNLPVTEQNHPRITEPSTGNY